MYLLLFVGICLQLLAVACPHLVTIAKYSSSLYLPAECKKYMQMRTNTSKFMQIQRNLCKYGEILINGSKYEEVLPKSCIAFLSSKVVSLPFVKDTEIQCLLAFACSPPGGDCQPLSRSTPQLAAVGNYLFWGFTPYVHPTQANISKFEQMPGNAYKSYK